MTFNMSRNNFKIFGYFLMIVFIVLGLSISFKSLLAVWTAPTDNPPNANADEPVNKGANLQIKAGPLYVNAGDNPAATGFTALGKVGIGTINPGRTLDINSGTGDNVFMRLSTGDATPYYWDITLSSDDGLYFQPKDTLTTAFRVTKTGQLGVYRVSTGAGNVALAFLGGTNRYFGFRQQDGTLSKLHTDYYDGSVWNTAMTIDTTGKVGIGTTNPTAWFHLKGSSATNRLFTISDTRAGYARDWGFTPENNAFAIIDITASNARRLLIDSTGNVGIGTEAPAFESGYKGLQIKAAANFGAELHLDTTDVNRNAALLFSNAGSNKWRLFNNSADNSFNILDAAAPVATVLTILDGGNVGISMTNPAYKLSVNGSIQSMSGGFVFPDGTSQSTAVGVSSNLTVNTLTITSENLTIGGTAPQISFPMGGTTQISVPAWGGPLFINGGGSFIVTTSVDGSINEARLTINNSGNVGIGVSEPQHKLDVAGGAKFTEPVIVAAPTANEHAATKSYVDGLISGISPSKWTLDADGIHRSGHVGIGADSYNPERAALRVKGGIFIEEGEEQTIWGNPALEVDGTVSASVKEFRILHPEKPGHDLIHSSLEGPEIGVYYRGQGKLIKGKTIIKLPSYFEKLTRQEGRTVLLTAKGSTPYLLSAGEVKNGEFMAYGTVADGEFYWEVKAVRADQPLLEAEALSR